MTLWLALLLAASPPTRVVSMAPGLTDLVVELGASERLVGVSRFDGDPSLSHLPRVGGYLDPDLEQVAHLKPDLVVALDGVSFAPVVRALRATGLSVLALRADTLEEVHQSLLSLGAALGLADVATQRWQALAAQLGDIQKHSNGRPKVRCAIVVGLRPLVLAGRGSYLETLIEVAGGENVSPSALAWPVSSAEQLVQANPQILILGEGETTGDRLLTILQSGGTRVVRLPNGDLFLPGPRAIRATAALARALDGQP